MSCSVVECGIEGTVLGTVAVGAIVLVATVARTNILGDVMAGDCRIYISAVSRVTVVRDVVSRVACLG